MLYKRPAEWAFIALVTAARHQSDNRVVDFSEPDLWTVGPNRQPLQRNSKWRGNGRGWVRLSWGNCFSTLNLSSENSKSALWSLSLHRKINKRLFFVALQWQNIFQDDNLGSWTAVFFMFHRPKIKSYLDKITGASQTIIKQQIVNCGLINSG